jgi:hypothetical protein
MFAEKYSFWIYTINKFLQNPVTWYPLGPNIFFSTIFSSTHIVRDQVPQTQSNRWNYKIVYFNRCLNENYRNACIGKYLSDNFPTQSGLKQGDALSPLLFSFALQYAVRKVTVQQVKLKLHGTYQFLVYADDLNLLRNIINTTRRNTETLFHTTKKDNAGHGSLAV